MSINIVGHTAVISSAEQGSMLAQVVKPVAKTKKTLHMNSN